MSSTVKMPEKSRRQTRRGRGTAEDSWADVGPFAGHWQLVMAAVVEDSGKARQAGRYLELVSNGKQ